MRKCFTHLHTVTNIYAPVGWNRFHIQQSRFDGASLICKFLQPMESRQLLRVICKQDYKYFSFE
jgi:hypothetical protein